MDTPRRPSAANPPLRLAYVVDGRMARGKTGSGHHIRNFFNHVARLGVTIACFDSLNGERLDPLDAEELEDTLSVRLWTLVYRAKARVGSALRVQRRVARAHLRRADAFGSEAFRPLAAFAPNFILCRMSHGNTFVHHAWQRLGVPYGLECNAPTLYQESRYGELVDPSECRRREARVLRGARFVSFVSDANREISRETEAYRQLPNQVIRNCADEAFFAPQEDRSYTRSRLGVSDHETLAVYVGSFKPWHRLDILADVAVRLKGSEVKFLLIGSGPAERQVRKVIRRHRIRDQVIFTGLLPHRHIPAYVAAADVGIQTGANEYSAPLKLVEYMAAGLPVLAPRVQPIREIFTDGRNSILLEQPDVDAFARSLLYLHQHPAVRARLGARARADAAPYTWTANAQQYLKVIDNHRVSAPTIAQPPMHQEVSTP